MATQESRRFIRIKEVLSITSLSQSELYRRIKAGTFPAQVGGLNCPRRYSAHLRIAGAFFVPAITFYGGLRGSTSVCAGSLGRRSANPAQPTTQSCLAAVGGGSYVQGATPMKHALHT